MKTRKKLLIALLSATCLTAGAFGLAACKDGNTDTKDPVLYGIYNAYVAETANPLSYEDWLKDKLSSSSEKGEQGEQGNPGANGKSAYEIYVESVYNADPDATPMTQAQWLASLNGVTPHIGENGNWYLGTVDTQVKAAGTNGTNGVGVAGVAMSEDGKSIVVSFTSGDPVNIALPDFITHKHTYGNEYTVVIPATGDNEGIGYKKCTDNGCDHYELYVIPSYAYKVTVYFSDFMGNMDSDNPTGTGAAGAKVTLMDGEKKVAEATTDENGEAIFNGIEKGEYTIIVEKDGFVAINPNTDKDFTEAPVTAKNVSDYPVVLVKSFNKADNDDHTTGDKNHAYQVTTELDSEAYLFDTLTTYQTGQISGYFVTTTYVDFTAPESGEYYFMGICINIGGDVPAPVNSQDGVSVVLNKGEKYRIAVDMGAVGDYDTHYTEAQLSNFVIFVMRGESLAGKEGTKACPIAVETSGKTTYTAKAEEEVYFKITASAGMAAKYKFIFGENVGIFALGQDIDYYGDLLESGDYIDMGTSEIYYSTTYYFVAGAQDGNIEFTVESYYLEGEKSNPVAITVGTEYDTANVGLDDVWYKLDVETAGKLVLERTSEDSIEFSIYDGVDAAAPLTRLSSDINVYDFKAGTYYIRIMGTCSFKVRAYDKETDSGNTADDPVTLEAGEKYGINMEYKYFKFVADKAGKFVVNAYGGNAYSYVYSDAAFENENYDYSDYYYLEVNEGDVLYIKANTYDAGTKISFAVVTDTDKVDYIINVVAGYGWTPPPVEGAVVTVKDSEGNPVEGVSATTDSDGQVTLNLLPGEYEIVIDLTGVEGNYIYSYPSYISKSYAATNTTVNLTVLYDYSYTVQVDGVAVPNLSFTYDGETCTTDANGKVTITADSTPHYYFSFEGTDYEDYTPKYTEDEENEYNYVLTLVAPAAPVEYQDLQQLSVGSQSINVDVRSGYTFVTPPDDNVHYYRVSISVQGGYIESCAQVGYPGGIQGGDESNTYFEDGFLYGDNNYSIVIVPTDADNGATLTITISYDE